MKVLIAHDGSDCAAAALIDLSYAGLPGDAEVLVLSVGDIIAQVPAIAAMTVEPGYYFPDDPNVKALNAHQLEDAQALADFAGNRLRAGFPKWHVETQAVLDLPEPAIVRKADEWKPDLIVVGSHGRSGIHRLFLGSVSQHVLKHAPCSVRIGRLHSRGHDRPLRLVLAADGSPDGAAAVRTVASREWPPGTEVRVTDTPDFRSWLVASGIQGPESLLPPEGKDEMPSQESHAIKQAVQNLTTAGLSAVPRVIEGIPTHVLVAEAERWDADCIFVGASWLHAHKRSLLGDAPTTVAERAHCSVEVVRATAQPLRDVNAH